MTETTIVTETDPSGGPDRSGATFVPDGSRGTIGVRQTFEAFSGPTLIPPPGMLAEYERLYPGAIERFFDHRDKQAEHRIKIEESVVNTNNTLALRGQSYAGLIGTVGVVGSFAAVITGHPVAGIVGLLTTVTSLVGLFLNASKEQKKQLTAKAEVRKKIGKGDKNPLGNDAALELPKHSE